MRSRFSGCSTSGVLRIPMSKQNSFCMFTRVLLPVLSVGVFALSSSAQTMTMLPGFDSTPVWSVPNAINGDGSVIVGGLPSSPSVRWARDSVTQTYGIIYCAGGEASGVSHDGSVVVGSTYYGWAYRWTASGGTISVGRSAPLRALPKRRSCRLRYWPHILLALLNAQA